MRKIFIYLGLIVMALVSCNQDSPVSRVSFFIEPACGSQLTHVDQTIFCRQIPPQLPVYSYRFIVKNEATDALIGTLDTPRNSFSLLDLGLNNLSLGTVYKIQVQVAFTSALNFTNAVNPACTVRTPDLPEKSKVIVPQCGSTVNSLWTTVFAKQTLGAEKYRFVVLDGTQTRIIESTESSFQLADLPGGPAANTVYYIRVDVLYKGIWYEGADLCSITTSPTASLRQTHESPDVAKSK